MESCTGSEGLKLRDGDDRQSTYALRTVNKDAFDIGGRAWTGHENAVPGIEAQSFAIGIVKIAHNPRGIEQNDQVLGQKAQRAHLELHLVQPDRAGLSDAKQRPDDADVNVI